MRKIAKAMGCVAASVVWTSAAGAQELGTKGGFALGLDRVLGFVHSSWTTELDGTNAENTRSTSNIAFLAQGGVPSPWSAPRLSFDYVVIDPLSIGGSLGYWSQSVDNDPGGEADASAFLLAPRVGYAYMFSEVFGIWPRGGLTFATGSSELGQFGGIGDASFTGVALSIDVPLVIAPGPHFAFLIGPAFDIGFGGGEVEPLNNDYSGAPVDIALQVGMVGWL
jgi:hypothetical protein